MTTELSITNCPACGEKSVFLMNWEFSGLNNSIFNYTADFFECPVCGLVYIANMTDEQLSIFYAEECSYFEKAHFDIYAPENTKKYRCYHDILVRAGLSNKSVTDIGCGRGGFLIWLVNNAWKRNCLGVDIDLKSIPDLSYQSNNLDVGITFQEGTAVAMPFLNESQEILTYFHVLEHIVKLDKVLSEAYRVLNENGHIMIEVPDAERYQDFPIGTAFWPSIREHIYHFSPGAIRMALHRNGFEMASVHQNILPTPEFSYPSLIVLAQKNGKKKLPNTTPNRKIASFFWQSKEDLKTQAQNILEFNASFSSLIFWGCSAELFSLLPIMKLHNITLCDSSKVKQGCDFKNIKIDDPTRVPKYGALIITPYLHADAIEKAAIELGWPKKAIFKLK